MTEELKKEAERYIIGQRQHYTMDFDEVHRLVVGFADYVTKELQAQIEKMKCCGNCSHRHYWGNELGCNLDLDKQFECDNNNKKYWEFSKE